jgi:hypothetical protein
MRTVDEIFKLVTGPNDSWHLELKAPLRTTDAVRQARDTLLSAEFLPMQPQMLGKTWVGDLTTKLNSLSAADRRAAIDGAKRALDDYASSMGPSNAGSYGTGTDARPEQEFGVGITPEALQRGNDEFWARNEAKPNTQDRTHRGPPTPASMNAAARALWASQPTHRLGPEYGKG